MEPVQGHLEIGVILDVGFQGLLDDKERGLSVSRAMLSSWSAISLGSLTDIAVFIWHLTNLLYYNAYNG